MAQDEPEWSTWEVAADGFPIDPALQKRSRSIAWGYVALALYFVAVVTFLLVSVLWLDRDERAVEWSQRSGAVVVALGYVAANLCLAIAAWHVLSMYLWASRAVLAATSIWTAWVWAVFAAILWYWFSGGRVSLFVVGSNLLLVLVNAFCTYALWRVVIVFDRKRSLALRQWSTGARP